MQSYPGLTVLMLTVYEDDKRLVLAKKAPRRKNASSADQQMAAGCILVSNRQSKMAIPVEGKPLEEKVCFT
jgi:hypothetical protein